MFGWGLYDFLGGVFAKQIGAFKSLFWSQAAGLVSILVLAVVFRSSFNVPVLAVILLPIAAVLYSAGYLFFFKGFESGNVSIIAAAMNLWAVFTMAFAFIFMGQRLSAVQTLGVAMIITGAVLASLDWRNIESQKLQFSAGVRETLLGAFFFGVFWNVSEIISEKIGWLLTTLYVKFGIILFLFIFSLLVKQESRLARASTKTKYVVSIMGIIEAGAVALVNYGLTFGDAILITPIASALSVVTILLAIIFLRDKITIIQGLGIITAIVGIILTAF